MNKNATTVYYAPCITPLSEGADWSFLYPKPNILFSSLLDNKSDSAGNTSFFSCPAFSGFSKKTLEFYSPMNASYAYDLTGDNKIFEPTSESFIATKYLEREPALNTGHSIVFELRYIMFADEPLDVFFTSPHFSKPGYMNYGSVIPGKFDIGQWFRSYNFEVQLWSDKGEFKLTEGEPLFYAHLNTDRPVIFKTFTMTPELQMMGEACISSTGVFGRGQSLLSRYKRFNGVGLKEKVLSEINKNLIE